MAGKFERQKKKRIGFGCVAIILVCCLVAAGLAVVQWQYSSPNLGVKRRPSGVQENKLEVQIPTEAETMPMEEEPEIAHTKVSTATIGATGDILLHDLVIKSGYDAESGSYNFDNIFKWFGKYVSEVDYAAANLEVTLCGDNNGYPYAGYPSFNSPDEIVDAAKSAGFDLLLTANNHSYDTGYTGFIRTQEVIEERELDHIGTRRKKDDKNYIVRDINGIKVGMICYTYCSGYNNAGNFMLNGTSLSADASSRINAFHNKDLNKFYMKLAGELQQMSTDGAEVSVVFMHWGTEYKTAPNESQQKIAQQLCDMGVDVIVGNHAHVAQPVELIDSTSGAHKTLCLYSTGNSVSNIYKSKKFPVHTEDGMLFTFTFAKYSNGTVLVESADVLPTWVRRYDEKGVRKFQILTMKAGADWKTEMDLTDDLLAKCQESFDRTMEIVGGGLQTANSWFAQHQEEIEIGLGIR